MTSHDIVDTLRQLERVFNDQDREGITALLTADVEWHPVLATSRSVYRGPGEVCELVLHEIPSVIERFRAQVVEIRDLGGGTAVAEVRFSGRGRSSGIPLDQWVFQVYRSRDGKVAYCRSYTGEQEALEHARPRR